MQIRYLIGQTKSDSDLLAAFYLSSQSNSTFRNKLSAGALKKKKKLNATFNKESIFP